MTIMTPKKFLLWGGIILVAVAILGFVGVIGPTSDQSLFGEAWWFDNGENVAHLVLGLVALLAAFALSASLQKNLTILVGVVAILFGLYSLALSEDFYGLATLQNPADTVLHFVIGIWALTAGLKKSA